MWSAITAVGGAVGGAVCTVGGAVGSAAYTVGKATVDGVSYGAQQTGKFVGYAAGQVVTASCSVVKACTGFNPAEIEKAAAAVEDTVAEQIADYLEKKGKKMGKKAMKAAIKKVLKKILIKFMTKSAIKKIPIAGLAAGTVFAAEKGLQGDWGAASLEFSSGAVACVPVAGTGASMAIDIGILAHEVTKELGSQIY